MLLCLKLNSSAPCNLVWLQQGRGFPELNEQMFATHLANYDAATDAKGEITFSEMLLAGHWHFKTTQKHFAQISVEYS